MKVSGIIAGIVLAALLGCTVREVSNDARIKTIDSAQVNITKNKAAAPRVAPPAVQCSPAPELQLLKERPPVEMEVQSPSAVADYSSCEKASVPVRMARAEKKCLRAAPARSRALCMTPPPMPATAYFADREFNTEQYNHISENDFRKVVDDPLSTFSIDVDKASYSNIRRFLNANTLPPKDAVRIEEMINYFTYNYPQPDADHPFSITAEVGACPWKADHKLIHIGLQGKKVAVESMPPSNLVFLLDVSGSMDEPDKLPLLKMAIKLLVDQLRARDRISITVYAGSAGLVLPSTPGNEKGTIMAAIDRLEAGGSTAGGEGIELAYATAKASFIKGGNNRVILATDGDFNVGPSSDGELIRMIEAKRRAGIYLTVLGFGTGNYKDSKMEQLADRGNGNYAYIDNLLEAKKVLVSEMGGTLLTIAKDVKIQIEFNPEHVSACRLVGYENRMLANRDFNDDIKDAGELGSGHTVTALYEIIPAGVKEHLPSIDPLKYQNRSVKSSRTIGNELCTVKFRYKKPDEDRSRLIEKVVGVAEAGTTSDNLAFSSAVAGFGMLLRDSAFKGDLTYDHVVSLARESKGKDANGYRSECIKLMEQAALLSSRPARSDD